MSSLMDTFIKLSPEPLYKTRSKGGEISDIEYVLNGKLPAGYREILEGFPFGAMFLKKLQFPAIEPTPWAARTTKRDTFDFFLGLKQHDRSVMESIDTYKDRIPDKFLPFGESSGGNLLCLSLREDSYGAIYFWDHEGEVDTKGNRTPEFSNAYLVANTFEDFVRSIVADDDDDDDDDDDIGLESITLRI
jgi:hypothetical protein